MIKKDNPMQVPYELMQNNFTKSDSVSSIIYISLGMEGIDKTNNNMWRSDILGTAIPDSDFNPYSKES